MATWYVTLPITAQSVAVGRAGDVRLNASVAARVVTVQVDGVPLTAALQGIAQQAGLTPFFGVAVQHSPVRVTLHVKNISVVDAFAQALRGTGLKATIDAHSVAFWESDGSATAAQGGITGTIRDAATTRPLRGASITVDGAEKGVVSADDGTFRLTEIAPGSHTLHVRLLGYMKTTRTVMVVEGQDVAADVTMERSISALEQVVVTGTVAATALKAVPNAITVVTAKQLEERGITHLDQLFRGDVPGVFAVNIGSATPLDSVGMYSRGNVALIPSNNPPIKTYVDGVELANSAYLSQIDPRSIDHIEILTGPQASTIYGSNAINGVMQIFTKRGTQARPQVTLSLLSGTLQNAYGGALAPQHDYSGQLSGVEGHVSYNAGASWNYIGHWSPNIQQTLAQGFGGSRWQGQHVGADVSLRLSNTQNLQRGSTANSETYLSRIVTGFWNGSPLRPVPTTWTLHGQTLGLTFDYTPWSWWSHNVVFGSDVLDKEQRQTIPGYSGLGDSTMTLKQAYSRRASVRYATTGRLPLTSNSQFTMTLGVDGWHTLAGTTSLNATTLTGNLSSASTTIQRQPGHNTGGFMQGQLAFADALFLTYGLRAEWNPNYGAEAEPNYAPRYGLAYTRDLSTPWGTISTKVRGSYGRSTRPPNVGLKSAQPIDPYYVPEYGNYTFVLANPSLGPEFQQGGEGGVELYFGRQASLVVTRYNQTTEHLIYELGPMDSVRSLYPFPDDYTSLDQQGYGYFPIYQNVNLGAIRNQGWELQGSMNIGPLTTKGTYSWTKSRVMGYDPGYTAVLSNSSNAFLIANLFRKGATFNYLPEHTWALATTYASARTSILLNVTGTGQIYNPSDHGSVYDMSVDSRIRLMIDKATVSSGRFPNLVRPRYALVDLNSSHRVTNAIELVGQIQNLTNTYRNESQQPSFAVLGRQSKIGVRLRY